MLHQIRPYCGIVVYLLLVCYGGSIGKQTFCDIYYSVAYTAEVLNASAAIWNTTEGHAHSQEEALLQLNTFQEAQEEEHQEEHQSVTDVPNQKLKYFKHTEHIDFEVLLLNSRNFLTAFFKPGHFKMIPSPPPQIQTS